MMYRPLAALLTCFAVAAHCDTAVDTTAPLITPAPIPSAVAADILRRQGLPIDPVSLANVLLTAFPESLREIAATNVPQVSRILWSEFLDTNTPDWFKALPTDIQGYLSYQYGPSSLRAQQQTTSTGESTATITTGSPVTSSFVTRTLSSSTSGTNTISSISSLSSDSFSSFGLSTSTQNAAVGSTAAPSVQNSDAQGLTQAQKIGIGLGVPLGLLAIAALVLLCCLISRRRRRSGREKSGDDGAPASAFITPNREAPSMEQKWAPLPVPTGFSNRGRDSGYGFVDDGSYNNGNTAYLGNGSHNRNRLNDDGFVTVAAGGAGTTPGRRSRSNSASRPRNSLQSVQESPMEFTHEHAAAAVPAPPMRRSRNLSLNGNNVDSPTLGVGSNGAFVARNARRSVDADAPNGTFALSPLNPAHGAYSGDDFDTHPAFRAPRQTAAMPRRPSYTQPHYDTSYGGAFGTSHANEYATLVAPKQSHHNGRPQRPASDAKSYSRLIDESWNGMPQSSRMSQPDLPQETDDWPLREPRSAKSSRYRNGSHGENRPLWDGGVYEGT